MIESLISYNLEELEKNHILSEARTLHKSKIFDKAQYDTIREEFNSNMYSPHFFIRILLFILSYIGMITVILPTALLFSMANETSYRILAVILGIAFIWITEKNIINEKKHYKSGVVEAGVYAGFALILVGILSIGDNSMTAYLFLGLLFSVIITVRYVDLLALLSTFFCFAGLLYQTVHSIGGFTETLLPFIFFFTFIMVYVACIAIEKKLKTFVFNSHLIIAKTLSLIIIYGSVNYFVVRELSISLMGFSLEIGQDIPFAFLFYTLTALLPILYIYYGIKKRSVMFLRVGLLIYALSIITFENYFCLCSPAISFTVVGIVLIAVSLWLLNYLKVMRNGFTRDNLINDKWMSQDLSAVIISQTLGGNKLTDTNNESFGGGSSGGAGATTAW